VTIHRMYAENGNRGDFWIQHRTWTNTCAYVQSLAPVPPDDASSSPADGQTLEQFHVRVFDIRSGRRIISQPPPDCRADRNYTRIAEPFWSHGLEKRRTQIH
jgi:hypothetical protein